MKILVVASLALGTALVSTGCDHKVASVLSKVSQFKEQVMQDPRVQALLHPQQAQQQGFAMQPGFDMPQQQGFDMQEGFDMPRGFDMPQAQGWDMPQAQGWDMPQAQGWDMPQAQGFDFAAHQNAMAQQAQGFNSYMNGIQAQSDRNAQAVENWTNTVIRGE